MVERRNFTFVIAPNYIHFRKWCALDNDPPENPNDPKFVVFWNVDWKAARGRRKQDGDRVIVLNGHLIEWKGYTQVLYGMIVPLGFSEQDIEWINT